MRFHCSEIVHRQKPCFLVEQKHGLLLVLTQCLPHTQSLQKPWKPLFWPILTSPLLPAKSSPSISPALTPRQPSPPHLLLPQLPYPASTLNPSPEIPHLSATCAQCHCPTLYNSCLSPGHLLLNLLALPHLPAMGIVEPGGACQSPRVGGADLDSQPQMQEWLIKSRKSPAGIRRWRATHLSFWPS